jgi:type II restriction/modification system DNA methylase subunit YeeA
MKQLSAAKAAANLDFYTNRCDGLDRQIDALVYELYGLTPDEIKIVERATA